MIKEIITDKEKLSTRCKEFNVLKGGQSKAIELLQNLSDTIESTDRLYLCANEIGYEERAFAIKFKDETEIFFNPAFQHRDKPIFYREKSYVDGKEYIIPRFTDVSLVFQDSAGKVLGLKFNEAASIIVCQAMNTIDGLFDSDYGLEIIPEFDQASREEQEEIIAGYAEEIGKLGKMMDEELSNNEETKDTWKAAKFYRAVADGEVEFDNPPSSNREKKRIANAAKALKNQFNKLKFWRKRDKNMVEQKPVEIEDLEDECESCKLPIEEPVKEEPTKKTRKRKTKREK